MIKLLVFLAIFCALTHQYVEAHGFHSMLAELDRYLNDALNRVKRLENIQFTDQGGGRNFTRSNQDAAKESNQKVEKEREVPDWLEWNCPVRGESVQ
ncbi:hypothetical protein TNCV_4735681 [Trichonephila clavipes]|nr:hypothetical protein TNCV_4735681 [Trichonephila clavipes]